jgi:hypothetical protein
MKVLPYFHSALTLLMGAFTSGSSVPDDFPLYFDVGGCSSSDKCMEAVENADVDRVRLSGIFECPHPCGAWPSYNDADGTIINNGIPQLANVTYHLEVLASTFDKYEPNISDARYVDLDYEDWSPIWERNSNISWYYNSSISLVVEQHPDWNSSQIEAEAKLQWETAAQNLILATLAGLRAIRPNIKIGLYNYPARFYYNGYDTPSGDELRMQNDRLAPVWCELDALFVSVYQFYNGSSSTAIEANNEAYVYNNIAEARRIADLVEDPSSSYRCEEKKQAVLAYTWHRYHDGLFFLEDIDEEMFWKNGSAAGADGLVMWGYESSNEDQEAFVDWYANDFAPLLGAWSSGGVGGTWGGWSSSSKGD